jgi:predicted permease
MIVIDTLAPILILIGLGAVLAKVRILGREFMADLNKLVFWVALPVLIFRSVADAGRPAGTTLVLIGVLFATTGVMVLAGYATGAILRAPGESVGTLVQSGFRGNLAYIGLPVLAYSFEALPDAQRSEVMATALLVMAPATALYNVLAIFVLQQPGTTGESRFRLVARLLGTNPLILACLAGIAFSILPIRLPGVLDKTLEALGAVAVPVALLCIGGSLASVGFVGRRRMVIGAVALKVLLSPIVAGLLGLWAGLHGADLRIAVVLAACPTATAAYIMARQFGGDEALASGSIAASTATSAISLAAVLLLVR